MSCFIWSEEAGTAGNAFKQQQPLRKTESVGECFCVQQAEAVGSTVVAGFARCSAARQQERSVGCGGSRRSASAHLPGFVQQHGINDAATGWAATATSVRTAMIALSVFMTFSC